MSRSVQQSKSQDKENDLSISNDEKQGNQTTQIIDNRDSTKQNQSLQKFANSGVKQNQSAQLKEIATEQKSAKKGAEQKNKTGLPDNLKSGVENLSGMSMDDVKVHYNSDEPAQLNAHAFAQGNDIHLASGQEEHLPHEAWHVVQQREGRVDPTNAVGGVAINDDPSLEAEADVQGAKALSASNETKQLKSTSDSAPIDPAIQRAEKTGVAVESSRLKQDDGGKPMGSKLIGSSFIGPTFGVGDDVEKVDFDVKKDGYYKAKTAGGDIAWADMSKVIDKEYFQSTGNVDDADSDGIADVAAEMSGNTSDLTDALAGGMENTWLKGVGGKGGIDSDLTKGNKQTKDDIDKGKFGDLKEVDKGVETAKNSLDFASGSLGALTSIYGMKKAWDDAKIPEKKWEAYANGAESLVGGVANSAKAVDGMAKALGNEDGTGSSDIVGKFSGAVNDGVSSVKNAFLGFMGLYKVYNSKSNTKGKDTLVSAKQITKAALDAAKVAKSAYDIIGKGIPTSLMTTIPGLSIAVSAINLIIRFADAWTAGDHKNDMAEESEKLGLQVATDLGDRDRKSALVFRKESRGIFPMWKDYYRVKPEIKVAIKNADITRKETKTKIDSNPGDATLQSYGFVDLNENASKAKANFDKQTANSQEANAASTDAEAKLKALKEELESKGEDLAKNEEYQKLSEEVAAANNKKAESAKGVKDAEVANKTATGNLDNKKDIAIKDLISVTEGVKDLPDPIKSSIKDKGSYDVDRFEGLSDDVKTYETVDKMAEINLKRTVSGYSDVAKEMINITADIVNLSGVGAIVGTAMKGLVGGASLAHAAGKGIQGVMRNKDEGSGDGVSASGGIDKSTNQKHREYVQHTQHIFRMLSLTKDKDGLEKVMSIVKATGVNTGMLFSMNGEPDKQAEMMVAAMKKRD